MTKPIIDLRDFGVRYRSTGMAALEDINLQLERGQCLLITGPTGCGKTTLLRSLAGLLHREGGVSITGVAIVNGMPIERVNLSEFAPRVGILFQNPDDQITGHTPREEIAFGLENLGLSDEEVTQRVNEALVEIELLDRADMPVDALSGGQKQRVAAAAVLAMHPDLLLLDEPISNLDWRGRRRLVEFLAHLKERGMTIVICSHETEELHGIADRAVRIRSGQIVREGEPEIFRQDSIEALSTDSVEQTGRPIVRLEGAKKQFGRGGFILGPIDLEVSAGEIVALLGPNGCGKTTLISLLAGILKPNSGSISLFGRRVRRFKRQLLRHIGYVAQNPDLMLHHGSVQEEMASRPRYLSIEGKTDSSNTDQLVQFNLSELRGRHPFSLSQGQRQRLALGAATAGGADLVLIDEPTTGQDSEQITVIQSRLKELASAGAAILLSTHNLRAAAEIATRAIVLVDGRICFDDSVARFLENGELLEELDYAPVEVLS